MVAPGLCSFRNRAGEMGTRQAATQASTSGDKPPHKHPPVGTSRHTSGDKPPHKHPQVGTSRHTSIHQWGQAATQVGTIRHTSIHTLPIHFQPSKSHSEREVPPNSQFCNLNPIGWPRNPFAHPPHPTPLKHVSQARAMAVRLVAVRRAWIEASTRVRTPCGHEGRGTMMCAPSPMLMPPMCFLMGAEIITTDDPAARLHFLGRPEQKL